jgi:acylglycerol lipase
MGNNIGRATNEKDSFEESKNISFQYWDLIKQEDNTAGLKDPQEEMKLFPRSRKSLGESQVQLESFILKWGMRVKKPFGTLIAYLSDSDDDDLFERVKVNMEFPMDYELMKEKGIFEILADYTETNKIIESEMMFHSIRGSLPRKIQGYLLDDNYRVLLKAKGNFVYEETDQNADTLRLTASTLERTGRVERIQKLLALPSSHPIQRLYYFSEVAKNLKRSKPEFIESRDQLKLAYRAYFPGKECRALVIEVSGNSFCCDITAFEVTHSYPIAYIIFDMRGYGHSGGARGTTPSLDYSLDDIKRIVRHFRLNYPGLPIFLLGASRVAGLILNYSSYKEKEPVEGYLFFNPNFGWSVKETWDAEKVEKMREMMNVNIFHTNLFLTCFTDGRFKKDTVGIRINIDDEIYTKNPLYVNEFSSNLMYVLGAPNPRKQLAELTVPFGLWITEEDTMMRPNKVVQLAAKARPDLMCVAIVKEVPSHWDHFCWSSKYLGPWVLEQAGEVVIKTTERPMKNLIDLTSLRLSINELQHPVWKNFRETVQLTVDLRVAEKNSKFFQSFDGTEIAYKEFLPESGQPIANLGKTY